jgi:1D-myo-inositol-tetrakisphosphate 5-kinase/inositol-polyphosphate multikinase
VATSKEYGKTIKEDQLGDALRKCFPDHLPKELLLSVLRTVISLLHAYQSEVQAIEWRLRGSSILIIYEGDPERLEAALQEESANENSTPLEGEDDSDDDSEDDEVEDFKPAVLLKAVDFAHAWDFRGQGPDEGYNEGLANLMALVEGRLQEVEEAL